MQHQMVTTEAQPSRAQIAPAALELLSRHSAGLLATARRYSATPEDAEDAYQRGVEILLTKAPTTTETDLLPWLKTVVKHEAFAVRKSSGRALPAEDPLGHAHDDRAWTDERAERYERLRVGAEAMAGLKPQEIRCLLLRAEGLSYNEICDATGFSYTKVNRCVTEGRRAFMKRVAGIEAGAECERLAPLISRIADGEATVEEMQSVRPHLKGCLACKATLREYRATPARLAGLVPPVAAIAGGGGGAPGLLGRLLDRFAGMGDVAGAKVAAVAATAVVLAGGGAAAIHHDPPSVPASAFADETPATSPVALTPPDPAAALPAAPTTPDPSSAAMQAVADAPAAARSASSGGASANGQSTPERDPQPEFDPGTAVGDARAASGPAASEPAASERAASTGERSDSTGTGEFGP